jgi:MFS family permease
VIYFSRVLAYPRDARLFLASSVLSGFAGSIQGLLFNLYLLSLGHGQDLTGLLTSIPAFAVMALALPFGLAAGKLGYRRAMLSGMLLQAAGFLGLCLAADRILLVGAGILGAVGATLGGVVGLPFLTASVGEGDRAHLFGFQAGATILSGMAGSALGGVLPGVFSAAFGLPAGGALAYRAALLSTLGLNVLAMIPIARIADRGRWDPPRWRHVLARRSLVGQLAAINLLIGLGAGLVIPFVNIFFRLRFDASDPALGTMFAINALLMGLGSFVAPALAARFGRGRIVVWSQGLSLPFLLLWGFGPSFAWAATGYLIRTPLMVLAGPVFSLLVMELFPPELRSGVNAMSMVSWHAGWALSSLASGYLQVTWGFAYLFPGTAVLYATALYLTWRCFSRLGSWRQDAFQGTR